MYIHYFHCSQKAEQVSESVEDNSYTKACSEEFIPDGPVGNMIRALRQVCGSILCILKLVLQCQNFILVLIGKLYMCTCKQYNPASLIPNRQKKVF